MSVAIRLMGGLGNMLFQIATGETWRERGVDVVYTNMDENLDYVATHYAFRRRSEDYKLLFRNFNWDLHKAPHESTFRSLKVPFTYSEIIPQDGVEYVGYFQSEKFFDNPDYIRCLFQPSEWANAQMAYPICEYLCSIHVRRQDYLKIQDYHPVLGMNYYKMAILTLEEFNRVDRYYVFSDDIAWCDENFKGDQFFFMTCGEYTAMFLMGLCKHNIIANSSLSWWGAYLGDPDERTVIAPNEWFGVKGEDDRDLIPGGWLKL